MPSVISIEEAKARLELLGYQNGAVRVLDDGRIAWVHRFIFTSAILVAWPNDEYYHDRWCYESTAEAVEALQEWNGVEPEGWHRNPKTGRRRPNGNACEEYISF